MSGPAPTPAQLQALRPLLSELNDLKRVRTALSDPSGTLAADRFRGAWANLLDGADAGAVAYQEAAAAVAAARLAGIDAAVLGDAGLDEEATADVLRRSIGRWADALPAPLPTALAAAAGDLPAVDDDTAARLDILFNMDDPPGFVEVLDRLADAPRAGATRPGAARLILTPEESHADHCYIVAVYAVLLAPFYDADAATVFLAGLSHHFHNAYLPDAGFTGEELLGEHLEPVMREFTDRCLDELPGDFGRRGPRGPRLPAGRLDPRGPLLPRRRRARPRVADALFRARRPVHDPGGAGGFGFGASGAGAGVSSGGADGGGAVDVDAPPNAAAAPVAAWAWRFDGDVRDPGTGGTLRDEQCHYPGGAGDAVLSADGREWPMIDHCPYLRVTRDDLRDSGGPVAQSP